MNKFSIDDITITNGMGSVIMQYGATIKAIIEIKCNYHGFKLGELTLVSQAKDMDQANAVRTAIQKLLDHKYYQEFSMQMPKCNCIPVLNKVHYDFNNLQEPFKTLFTDLFTDSNWTIQELITYPT